MKKGLFIVLFTLFAMSNIKAQTSVGVGVFLSGGTAVELKADFGISDAISVSPSFDYFMNSGNYAGTKISMMLFGVDGHYNLGDPEALNYYPILGVHYLKLSASSGGYGISVGGAGLTAGFGATYGLSDSMKLYGEAKYMMGGFGLSAGLLFNL